MSGPRPIDAFIIGAQKAGTSSLSGYLQQHPAICSRRRKELSYFVNDRDYAAGYAANFQRYFGACPPDTLLLGKSVTVMADRTPIERLWQHNPRMRLLAVLRNPVDRAYSGYWWARQNGYETLPTFEAALDADPARHRGRIVATRLTAYVALGRYADQLAQVLDVFPREQLQVLLLEDLAADAQAVCRRTFEFLGVDPTVHVELRPRENAVAAARSVRLASAMAAPMAWKRAVRRALPGGVGDRLRKGLKDWNAASFSPPPMEPATRARLVQAFAADNVRLAELIGRDLSAWSGLDR